jgi:hypothetical protein
MINRWYRVALPSCVGAVKLGRPPFVQISDTHIGFNREANPDVAGSLTQTIDVVNAMSKQPALIITRAISRIPTVCSVS